jgi:hypothetical protein
MAGAATAPGAQVECGGPDRVGWRTAERAGGYGRDRHHGRVPRRAGAYRWWRTQAAGRKTPAAAVPVAVPANLCEERAPAARPRMRPCRP